MKKWKVLALKQRIPTIRHWPPSVEILLIFSTTGGHPSWPAAIAWHSFLLPKRVKYPVIGITAVHAWLRAKIPFLFFWIMNGKLKAKRLTPLIGSTRRAGRISNSWPMWFRVALDYNLDGQATVNYYPFDGQVDEINVACGRASLTWKAPPHELLQLQLMVPF